MDVPTTIMPAFHAFPKEAAIIGRLLAGYGELEFMFYECVKVAVGNSAIAARLLYRVRSEKTRQDLWDAIMRPVCEECSIEKEYELAFAAANYCRKVRNQYAHCHWFADPDAETLFLKH